jgi:hypothetical protein
VTDVQWVKSLDVDLACHVGGCDVAGRLGWIYIVSPTSIVEKDYIYIVLPELFSRNGHQRRNMSAEPTLPYHR